MTTEDFKKANPQLAHLEGDALWDAMTTYGARQIEGQKILSQIRPFWKRYTVRWIFYRKTKNWILRQPNYKSPTRCKRCKNASSFRMIFSNPKGVEELPNGSYHVHCGKKYIEEPNTNLDHRLWKLWKPVVNFLWDALDWIHLVRNSSESRYGMFGDESYFILSWTHNMETGASSHTKRSRKWWEYIIIENPNIRKLT